MDNIIGWICVLILALMGGLDLLWLHRPALFWWVTKKKSQD